MAVDDVATTRKYLSEFTLGLTIDGRALGRQQEFQRIEPPEDDYPCHLYIVSRRPRISVLPDSVQIDAEHVRGRLRLQRQDHFDEYEFDSHHQWGAGPLEWQSEWPFEEYAVIAEGRRVAGGVVALLGSQVEGAWPDAARLHEVVYIGQAFGRSGERTAWDRLRRHETVQRVLAETPADTQVWLTLAAIVDLQLYTDMDPTVSTSMSSEEDDQHTATVLKAITEESFAEKEAVAMAEAGLIRMFQPEYNDRLKYTFPARRQVSLETIRSLDFHGLGIELQGDAVDALFWSDTREPAWIHFGAFAIHTDADRADSLFLQAIEGFPEK